MSKITLSTIKADVGGFVGHSSTSPALIETAEEHLSTEKGNLLEDFEVMNCGDDLFLIMSHREGTDAENIHSLAWDTFMACTEKAKEQKLYGAGQDLLKDAFSGNVKGMGPGVAEMEFEERKSDPVLVFMADKTSPGAWNLPLYKIFGDPSNTAGLVIDPTMHEGFEFRILDAKKNKEISLYCPEDLYDLLVFLGAPGRFMVTEIRRREDDRIAAAASTQKLSYIAGQYVGKDDPALIVRGQSGFPAVGEVTEAFSFPHMVEGFMRGSHVGPLMPCSFEDSNPSRFDGPPRLIGAGFQVTDGELLGPRDLFDDPIFDRTREKASEVTDYLRNHGPFEPHRLPLEEMEYTTLPQVAERLEDRWEDPEGESSTGSTQTTETPSREAMDVAE